MMGDPEVDTSAVPDPPPLEMMQPMMQPAVAQQIAQIQQAWSIVAKACRPDRFVGTIPEHEQLQQALGFVENVLRQSVATMQSPPAGNGSSST